MTAPLGPVERYLPHRPPMLLIDEIVDATETSVVCKTQIRPDCVFATDGIVHPAAMIEIVAQACAICSGMRAGDGKPRSGMLVGCREAAFSVDSFAVGDELTITVEKLVDQPQLTTFAGTVTRDGASCVTMQLSVVEGEP